MEDQKIIIRHRNGSRKDQRDEFPLAGTVTITMGRDPSCEVVYDVDRDDVVSRAHCKISAVAGNPPKVTLADLGSRNGTYLNRQRISAEVTVTPGDVVQLGPGGPEFEFDMHPRPVPALKPTRLASEIPTVAPPPTREATPVAPPHASIPAAPPVPAAVGKATVERMIQSSQQKSRTPVYLALASLMIAATVLALVIGNRRGEAEGRDPGAVEVARKNTDSVVFIEVGWKIVDIESGRQLYHVAMPNKQTDESGNERPLVPGGPAFLPVFTVVNQQLEPMLSTEDGGGNYRAIGGSHTGSGFVVSDDGFLLTNRHVASAWLTRYSFQSPVGVVLQMDEQLNVKNITPIPASQFPAWVAADAKFVIHGALGQGNIRIVQKSISGKSIEGRNDYLDVTFAKNRVRIPGKLARVSDQIDVAMVKIDIPRKLQKVDMFDNYEAINPGDGILVLGYPAASPVVVGAVQSKDVFRTAGEAKVIPDPTLSVGNIGRVIRGQAGLNEATYSTFGDVYQLTVNSTGPGNSGGPVFDSRGRVIGIFTSGTTGDTKITFAVPIRYGMELMGTQRVM